MTFSAEIVKSGQEITTLISLRPRVRSTDWVDEAVVGQNVYSIPWAKGNVVGVYDQSFSSLDEDTEANMLTTAGTFFFDEENETLYANFSSSGPNSRVVVIEWDVFFSTKALNWYRVPTNSASDDQYWNGGLQKPPIPSQGNADLLFGFTPVSVSNVDILIETESLEELYEWSLNGSRVKIWECAGELDTGNISEVFTGVAGDYSLNGPLLSVAIADPMLLIDQRIDEKYYSVTDFPNIEPQRDGAPVRTVYGAVEGFVGINVDYAETPSTTDNRIHAVSDGQSNKAQLTAIVDELDVDTTDASSKVDDASGFRTGDSIVVEEGGSPHYGIMVTGVDYVTNVIQHTSIPGRVPVAGDEIRRGFVGRVLWDIGTAVNYELAYERDWTEGNLANGIKGITLANNFEANHAGAPAAFDPTEHRIYMTVYGENLVPKKLDGITDFCSVADSGGGLANPVGLLWKILRDEIRTFREVITLDETSWFNLAASIERPIGFAIPEESTGSFGSWKDIIQLILQSELLRLHIKVNNGTSTLMITRDGPTGTADHEISQEEVAEPKWAFSYSDVRDSVIVDYDHLEFSTSFFSGSGQPQHEVVSNVARYLHRVSRALEIKILHYNSNDALAICTQFAAILSERRGVLTGLLPPAFMESKIGDTVQYGSKFLPGAAISESYQTRNFKLQNHAKSPSGISVVLDDQKGIEDFSGTWEP